MKEGISKFGRFTLSNADNPLAGSFTEFKATCQANNVLITWKTAQEQNSSRFDIEASPDGIRWVVIGNLPAAGNSNTEKTYSFTDNNPLQNGFYRIAEYDLDGSVHYTGIIQSTCNTTDVFNVWPNPIQDIVFVNIVTGSQTQVMIKVFDSKGALVKLQNANVLQGSTKISVNMSSLAKGTYALLVSWNNGQVKKTVKVIKQ